MSESHLQMLDPLGRTKDEMDVLIQDWLDDESIDQSLWQYLGLEREEFMIWLDANE